MKSLLFAYFGWSLVVVMLEGVISIITGIYNVACVPDRFIQLLLFVLSAFFTLSLYSIAGENFKNKASREQFSGYLSSFIFLDFPSSPRFSLPLRGFFAFSSRTPFTVHLFKPRHTKTANSNGQNTVYY